MRPPDELTLDDLSSAKSTRTALHRGLLQRKPGQYTLRFFARRLGLSVRTIHRYNHEDEHIHCLAMYHEIPVYWHNLEAVIPADPDVFPHEGVFLADEKGGRYPPLRPIARKLLAKKHRLLLKRRVANYWWYGDEKPPAAIPIQQTQPTPARPEAARLLALCRGSPGNGTSAKSRGNALVHHQRHARHLSLRNQVENPRCAAAGQPPGHVIPMRVEKRRG
jgi:hypothetical protein